MNRTPGLVNTPRENFVVEPNSMTRENLVVEPNCGTKINDIYFSLLRVLLIIHILLTSVNLKLFNTILQMTNTCKPDAHCAPYIYIHHARIY